MRCLTGHSLVELLVALTLLSVGALALAGSSAAAVRAAREGRTARVDAARSRAVLERSVAAGCPGTAEHVARLVQARVAHGRFAGAPLFALRTC